MTVWFDKIFDHFIMTYVKPSKKQVVHNILHICFLCFLLHWFSHGTDLVLQHAPTTTTQNLSSSVLFVLFLRIKIAIKMDFNPNPSFSSASFSLHCVSREPTNCPSFSSSSRLHIYAVCASFNE